MLEANATCQVKGAIKACGATATAQCVYCARTFCAKHGEVMEDGFEVCSRKVCTAKKEDLHVHLTYKAFVLERNLERLCGISECETSFQVQCNRCRGYFCVTHTRAWLETVTEKPERTCSHCLERRPIWEKD
jgi:hypothetical protein